MLGALFSLAFGVFWVVRRAVRRAADREAAGATARG
jgi:hypothetical protein